MTALPVFAICIVLTIIISFIALLLLGQGFLMLALILPAHAADLFTRGSSLNYNSRTILYKSLFGLFILTEILLISSIFFGLYCLVFGYPHAAPAAAEILRAYSPADLTRLTYINQILLLMEVYFVLMFTYYSIKHRQQFSTMKGFYFFSYRVLPVVSFPLAFIYLIAALRYLSAYPNYTINMLALVAGYLYVTYSIYALGKTLFMYSRTFRYNPSGLTFRYWINLAITILYNIVFLYFFYLIHSSI